MDISILLKKAMITWDGPHEELKQDFAKILTLISGLPEPQNLDIQYDRFAPLFPDEPFKEAAKEDILSEDMFLI